MPDIDNLNLKHAENHYLVRAVTDKSLTELAQFAILRRARARIIGTDALELEQETKLGMAEYNKLIALPRAELIDQIAEYIAMLKDPKTLLNQNLEAGAILAFALKNLGIEPTSDKPLFNQIPHQQSPAESALPGDSPQNHGTVP